jgi:SAM-dependent methyltransferase
MEPADYDAWYGTPRGAWIGEQEFRLLRAMLGPRPGETLLDVGCGTGYFTRRFAARGECPVTGLDIDCSWAGYAASHAAGNEAYVCGTAIELPFGNNTFDLTVSVAALCFVTDQRRGIQEILRVTKRRFAIGLLHRRSLLYVQKGRCGGKGAYRGAHWHTESEIRELFSGLLVANLQVRSAVALPAGGAIAQFMEPLLSPWWPFASFIAVAGDVVPQSNS